VTASELCSSNLDTSSMLSPASGVAEAFRILQANVEFEEGANSATLPLLGLPGGEYILEAKLLDKIAELKPWVSGFLLTVIDREGEMNGFDLGRLAHQGVGAIRRDMRHRSLQSVQFGRQDLAWLLHIKP